MSCEKTSSFFNCEESPKITSEKSATVYPSTPLFSKVKIHILTRKSVVYMYVVLNIIPEMDGDIKDYSNLKNEKNTA